MCGILGFVDTNISSKKILESFKYLQYRGNDAYGLYDNKSLFTTKNFKEIQDIILNKKNNFILLQNLFAINNFIPQPLETKKSIFLWNGEIYNWRELSKKHNIKCENDSQLFQQLLDKFNFKILTEINGDYSVCYYNKTENKIFLFRDNIGIKPLFYNTNIETDNNEGNLIFSSDITSIKNIISNPQELNPRTILEYNLQTKLTKFIKKEFYAINKNPKNNLTIIPEITEKLSKLLTDSIKKRVEGLDNIIVLFSGGIDSSLICFTLKKLNINFTCITAGIKNSKDIEFAKKVAEYYDFNHQIIEFSEEEIIAHAKKISQIIDSTNYIKISVALPFYFALSNLKSQTQNLQSQIPNPKSQISKVVLSGLGSEEIFAGYSRFDNVININTECINGLLNIHERDLYRDDVISLHNKLEMRLPFLDKDLIEYTLKIDESLKIKDEMKKYILVETAKQLGYKKEFAERKKLAAQYGSGTDKLLQKIAKKKGIKKGELITYI